VLRNFALEAGFPADKIKITTQSDNNPEVLLGRVEAVCVSQ
jgi:hypothetical protein